MILLLLIFFNTRKVSNLLFANGIVLYLYRRRDERYKTLKFKTPQTVVHAAARALEPARGLFAYARACGFTIHM